MNDLDYGVVTAELARARGQLEEARQSLRRVRSTAAIVGGVAMPPIHLAHYQVEDTIRLIDQSLGHAPEPPPALGIDELIAHAKARLSPSFATENMGSADSAASREAAPAAEGEPNS